MGKFTFALRALAMAGTLLLPTLAHAQNHTCPTASAGDSTNKCASTAFVQQAIGGGSSLPLASGKIYIGSLAGVAAAQTLSGSGDCSVTLANNGVATYVCTKTNGVGFATSATVDTTNAGNISSGTLPGARLPAPAASALGGVQSKDCSSGSQFVQKINTDGTETCATPGGGLTGILDVTQHGLKADFNGVFTDGVSNSTTTFTSASAAFTAGDVNKAIAITISGVTAAYNINAVVNSATITLSSATPSSGSGLSFFTGTNNAPALNALFAGGVNLWFPPGNYLFSTKVNITTNGVTLQGSGPSGAAALFYVNGGVNNFIDIQSAQYTTIRNLTLESTAADWTGFLIAVRNTGSDPAQTTVDNVSFGMAASSGGMTLDTSIENYINNTRFSGGFTAIQGASSGGYVNVLRMTGGQFTNQGNAAVRSGGNSWTFNAVTFEGRSDGKGLAFQGVAGTLSNNLNFTGCWFGDSTVGGGTWVSVFGQGFTFVGNLIFGISSTDTAIALNNVKGFNINGNTFSFFVNGINYAGATVQGGLLSGNGFHSVTNFEANTGNKDASVINTGNISY